MNLNILWTIIWHENIKCCELIQWVMWQNDITFINILNRFWIVSQTFGRVKFIVKVCLRLPPIDATISHLFYTNVKTILHNKEYKEN
jgi:hypothetical protein